MTLVSTGASTVTFHDDVVVLSLATNKVDNLSNKFDCCRGDTIVHNIESSPCTRLPLRAAGQNRTELFLLTKKECFHYHHSSIRAFTFVDRVRTCTVFRPAYFGTPRLPISPQQLVTCRSRGCDLNAQIPVLQTGPLTVWVPRHYDLTSRLIRFSNTTGDWVPAFFIRLLIRSFRVRSTCSAFRCSSTRRRNSSASTFVKVVTGTISAPNTFATKRGSIVRTFGGVNLIFRCAIF